MINDITLTDGWIVIVGWEKFQHYGDRNPPWIKNYKDLLHKEQYLELSWEARGVLHGLWLAYARSNRELSNNTAILSRLLGKRVLRKTLISLNHAGFIQFSASNPLALARRALETETET